MCDILSEKQIKFNQSSHNSQRINAHKLQATLKFRLAVKKIKQIVSINKFFENVLINNPKGKRANRLAQEMTVAFRNMKIFVVLTVLCFGVFILYPVYAYVTEHRLIQLARLEFPFLNQTNLKGYLIGVGIMLLTSVSGVIGSVAFDLVILMLLLQYGSLVTQFVLDLEEYHELWTNIGEFSPQYRDYFLKNIFKKYQDINRLMFG